MAVRIQFFDTKVLSRTVNRRWILAFVLQQWVVFFVFFLPRGGLFVFLPSLSRNLLKHKQ